MSDIDLVAIARRVMRANGFTPDIPAAAEAEIAALTAHPPTPPAGLKDLRDLPWSSIDNDDSRDLDQIEVAKALENGRTRVYVGIADVDLYVKNGTAIDGYAAQETTSVYTGVHTFPMLPPELSTAATSLNESGERAAMVTEFVVDANGDVTDGAVYPALVRNHAKLAYDSVAAWLEGRGQAPAPIAASATLQDQLRLQDRAAQQLRQARHRDGALEVETHDEHPNRATDLIEDFMIAVNGVVARTLAPVSSIRRIVKTPKRWDRIVALAGSMGGHLPETPDSRALNVFLAARKAADPERFADLSLSIIKLLGPGEYVLERPGDPPQGHFGLAVQDYTHSTAPNRRFADLVTQRILKAFLGRQPAPYSDDELTRIAAACTDRANAAQKVEREMKKRLAAQRMSDQIGHQFEAIVTGASEKGTFVRVTSPYVEGMLVHGKEGLDVGDHVRVRLIKTDIAAGYIDFERVR